MDFDSDILYYVGKINLVTNIIRKPLKAKNEFF